MADASAPNPSLADRLEEWAEIADAAMIDDEHGHGARGTATARCTGGCTRWWRPTMPDPDPELADALERFVEKAQLPDGVPPWTLWWSCWHWTGGRNGDGYGGFQFDGRKQNAHRAGFMIRYGPVPDDMVLDHLCRVRTCVNPLHLEVVTQRTNILRSTGPAAVAALQQECIYGHPFSAENTRWRPDGSRMCRTCRRHIDRIDGRMRAVAREWMQKHRPDVVLPSGQAAARKWLHSNEPDVYASLRQQVRGELGEVA